MRLRETRVNGETRVNVTPVCKGADGVPPLHTPTCALPPRQTLHTPEKVAAGLVVAPELEALVDAAYARTTWEAFHAAWARLPLTLVHGDFHPVRRGAAAGRRR